MILGAGIGLWVGMGVLITVKPEILDFMRTSSSGGLSVSASRLAEIVEEIRGFTRKDWRKSLAELREATALMETARAEHYTQIRTAKSDAILAEFVRLTENHHQPVRLVDRSDPTLPRELLVAYRSDPNLKLVDLTTVEQAHTVVADLTAKGAPERYLIDINGEKVSLAWIFEEMKSAEMRLTNAYRDIVGAKNLLKLDVPPIDAVSWVKVVPPRRISLQQPQLDHEVRSTSDGSLDYFKDNVKIGASEIDAMKKYAQKMLEKAGLDDDGKGGEGWANINDQVFGSNAGETLLPDELSLDDNGGQDDDFDSVAGRYVGPRGSANQNIFVDKWYVLGPFENRFRSNLDASFMPESVIDLENPVIGKDDKEISWEYWRMPKVRIEPSWAPRGAVYYGWTEVYVEEEGGYWMSMGSDDYGKLWVNGELVWKSDTRPKSFKASEHTAEFQLKRGINELLMRCENNGGTMGWALIIHNKKE